MPKVLGPPMSNFSGRIRGELPNDMVRSYNTRVNGIFKKAAELHKMFDGDLTVSIVIQKPGTTSWLFNTGEQEFEWPEDINALTLDGAIIRRPSHYLTLNEGISRGRVQIVGSTPPPRVLGIIQEEEPSTPHQAEKQLMMRTVSPSPSRRNLPVLRPTNSRLRNARKAKSKKD